MSGISPPPMGVPGRPVQSHPTDANARERLSSFIVVRMKKADVTNDVDEGGYALTPSWVKVERTMQHDAPKREATRHVCWLSRYTEPVEEKKRCLPEKLRDQLDDVQGLMEDEETDHRFYTFLAQIATEYEERRAEHEPSKPRSKAPKRGDKDKDKKYREKHGTRPKDGRYRNDHKAIVFLAPPRKPSKKSPSPSSHSSSPEPEREPQLVAVTAYFKRVPRTEVNCLEMYKMEQGRRDEPSTERVDMRQQAPPYPPSNQQQPPLPRAQLPQGNGTVIPAVDVFSSCPCPRSSASSSDSCSGSCCRPRGCLSRIYPPPSSAGSCCPSSPACPWPCSGASSSDPWSGSYFCCPCPPACPWPCSSASSSDPWSGSCCPPRGCPHRASSPPSPAGSDVSSSESDSDSDQEITTPLSSPNSEASNNRLPKKARSPSRDLDIDDEQISARVHPPKVYGASSNREHTQPPSRRVTVAQQQSRRPKDYRDAETLSGAEDGYRPRQDTGRRPAHVPAQDPRRVISHPPEDELRIVRPRGNRPDCSYAGDGPPRSARQDDRHRAPSRHPARFTAPESSAGARAVPENRRQHLEPESRRPANGHISGMMALGHPHLGQDRGSARRRDAYDDYYPSGSEHEEYDKVAPRPPSEVRRYARRTDRDGNGRGGSASDVQVGSGRSGPYHGREEASYRR
ncbi:hypothetical protein GMORB2_6690 [Geosmithia morbida]|uniref:Uncharacterized protein n=1 Tax=Geosmithia morbida TaxID=1094350 RepID=A0A9P4YWL9_9HYPO|nr:uncharacterized protein GMORB2_6690 [Geosmithia morbida]KAF4123142.1 hypothetical protein GMORB2_6690 [Geosmithia morbida]